MSRPKRTAAKYRRLSAVIRVSRVNGREGESYHSPTMQMDAIKAWAEAHGVEIVSWHREEDRSGKTTDRPGLNAAMREAFDGSSDGIIVAKVDRFSRNMGEGLKAVHKLTKAGKAFVAVEDGIDGLNPQSIGNRVLLMWLLFMAEWYLDNLTENWERIRERHVAAGIAGNAPYGYRKDKATKKLVPYEPEAKWVRLVFKWRAQGKSLRTIARMLNDRGAPRPEAGQWIAGTVGRMVSNRTYLGELWIGKDRGKAPQFDEDGDPIEALEPICNLAAHKPLVSRKLWDSIDRDIKPGRTATYPLTGILRCASCGGRMRGNTDHYKPEVHGTVKAFSRRSYRCAGEYTWGNCPRPARIMADEIEAFVFERFDRDYLSGRAFVGAKVTDNEALVVAQNEVDEIEAELDGLATDPVYVRMKREAPKQHAAHLGVVLDRLSGAKARVRELEAEARGFELPAGLVDLWPEMDDDERRAVLVLAYPVVAIAPLNGARRGSVPPVDERVRVFASHDDDMPTDLPGRGGGKELRPIDVSGAPV